MARIRSDKPAKSVTPVVETPVVETPVYRATMSELIAAGAAAAGKATWLNKVARFSAEFKNEAIPPSVETCTLKSAKNCGDTAGFHVHAFKIWDSINYPKPE